MKRIFAISDTGFRPDQMADKVCVKLLHKEHPKILLLPAALEAPMLSPEALEHYVAQFHKRYRDELGCETDVLFTNNTPTEQTIREKILSADAVYVAPGHVPTMMEKMKQFGIDSVLKEAYDKEILMMGLSAGAMCWFKPYLGFVDTEFYPHYEGYEPIRQGYAATDGMAALFLDGKLSQILRVDPTANIYLFTTKDGKPARVRIGAKPTRSPNTNG